MKEIADLRDKCKYNMSFTGTNDFAGSGFKSLIDELLNKLSL